MTSPFTASEDSFDGERFAPSCELAVRFEALDNLAAFVAKALAVQHVCITVLDGDGRYQLAATAGLEPGHTSVEPIKDLLSHCRAVAKQGKTLSGQTNRLSDNPTDGRAWLGAPVLNEVGETVGTICLLDELQRSWSAKDMAGIHAFARQIASEINIHLATSRVQQLIGKIDQLNSRSTRVAKLRQALTLAYFVGGVSSHGRIQCLLTHSCQALGMSVAAVNRIHLGQHECMFVCGVDGANPWTIAKGIRDGLSQQAMDNREVVQASEAQEFGGHIASPLIFDGHVYGVLEFISSAAERSPPLERDELMAIELVSTAIAFNLVAFGHVERVASSRADRPANVISFVKPRPTVSRSEIPTSPD